MYLAADKSAPEVDTYDTQFFFSFRGPKLLIDRSHRSDRNTALPVTSI